MMYKDEAAIAIKVDGKVVREVNPGTAKVPFGSEYSVYFKNLSDRKCVLKVSIDGKDVLNGSKIIVDSNKSVDLERYLDSMNKGNKFKFAKMTDAVASNRGVKAEDGVIRVSWDFEEKIKPVMITSLPIYHQPTFWYSQPNIVGGAYTDGGNNLRSLNQASGTLNVGTTVSCFHKGVDSSTYGASATMDWCGETTYASASCAPFEEQTSAGFTTKGDISNQKFTYGSIGQLEHNEHSVCYYLVGTEAPVVTTQDKIKCAVCGTLNKFGSKFCSECGTYIAKV